MTVGAEIVRRHARDLDGDVFLVQQEELRLRPDVCRVERDVYRHIADNADPVFLRVAAQSTPLAVEKILHIGEKAYVLAQLVRVFLHGVNAMQADILRPLIPCAAGKMLLERHVQRKIGKPARIIAAERFKPRILPRKSAPGSHAQKRHAVFPQRIVIDAFGVAAPIDRLDLVLRQQPVVNEHVEVYKISVAGKARKALIRRIAAPGRADGQDLPPRLSGRGKKIHKLMRRPAERSYTVLRRQREQRQKHAAASFYTHNVTSL